MMSSTKGEQTLLCSLFFYLTKILDHKNPLFNSLIPRLVIVELEMAKGDPSDLNSDSEREEEESSEKLSEEEEEEPENPKRNKPMQVIPDYEKQRLSRMAENKARMEALGLHKMASSLMGSAHKSSPPPRLSIQSKGKHKLVDEDDDYKPSDDDTADDQDDNNEVENEDDEDFAGKSSSKSRKKKAKNKGSKPKKKVPLQMHFSSTDYINEDDDELMQAIALSLQGSAKDATSKEMLENANIQEDAGRKKRKKSFSNRLHMTEDELILHFFQFDESGRGFLTVRDLQRVATAHDFTWTDTELADMIQCFDSDGDGKLNLNDFQKIASRCNMLLGSGNCR